MKEKQNLLIILGITLINLIITIIVIIILAGIGYSGYTSFVGNAQFSKCVHEISEVEQVVSNLRSYNEQTLRASAEEDLNKGFRKVYLNNVPDDFVSFDKNDTTGYYIDLENINKKELVLGHQRLSGISATFGKDDIFVYDQTGKVYYVKGFPNSEGKMYHRGDSKANLPILKEPVIESVSYQLLNENAFAQVSIVAKSAYGGDLKVRFGDVYLQEANENTYTTNVNENKSYSVLVKEENGYYSSVQKIISGIVIMEDRTPPEIDKMEIVYSRNFASIDVEVHDYESKIVGYSFSTSPGVPTTWEKCNSNYFSKVFDAPVSDTYYFYAINEYDLNKSASARVEIVIEYIITFDNKGGTGGPGVQRKRHGENLSISSSTPTRATYTFRGWSENRNATTVNYLPGGTYEKEGDTTLYAVWERNGYSVVYDSNGGEELGLIATKVHGEDLVITSLSPTREGYTFMGWAESNEATAVEYVAGQSYVRNEDTTMFAVWRENSYTVEYNANGGEGEPNAQLKYSTKDLALSTKTPTRTGYDFAGWAESASALEPQYQPAGKYSKNEDVTLFAVWRVKTYTITYYGNGGVGAPSVEVKEYGATYTITSATPTKQGHIFKGWSTSNTATTPEYVKGQFYSTDANLVLYAVWQKESYTIKYDANGGGGAPVSQEKVYNETLTLSSTVPTYTGYVFSGWGLSANATISQFRPGDIYTDNTNVTLYAIWTARVAILLDGSTVNVNLKALAGSASASLNTANDNITTIEWSNRITDSDIQRAYILSTSSSNTYVYAWFDNGVVYLYSEAQTIMLGNDSAHLFDNLRALRKVDMTRFVSNETMDMNSMFRECQSLDEVDLLTLDTAKVTNFENMFYNCSSLTSLNLSSFDTGNVTNMNNMFNNCTSIRKITVSEMFVTTKINNTSNNMFLNCTELKGEQGTRYNAENVGKEYARFDGGLTSPGYFYKFISPNVKYTITFDANSPVRVNNMPEPQVKRHGIDLVLSFTVPTRENYVFIGWSTQPGEDNTVQYFASGKFDLNEDTKLYAVWFKSAQFISGKQFNVTIKKLAGAGRNVTFETEDSNITKIEWLNAQPDESVLGVGTNVGLSTGAPIYAWYKDGKILLYSKAEGIRYNNEADYMFSGLTALTSLNPIADLGISGSTDNITNMSFFLYKCSSLTTIDISQIDTTNVTNMGNMFAYCSKLRILNLRNFVTSRVVYMYEMFRGCTELVSLDLRSFDTRKVLNMDGMFYDCSKLASLNLTSFDTRDTAQMKELFKNCSELYRIYATELFATEQITENNSMDMFKGCTSIEGDYGTRYDEAHINKEYAHLDGGADNKGYFSAEP